MQIIFWLGTAIIIYTYLGYALLLGLIVKLKPKTPTNHYKPEDLPEVTLIVACYNEAPILKQKIENTLKLAYPEERLKIFFVTDGSDDNSGKIISQYPQVEHHHKDGRAGKNAAVNRVMKFVKTPIVIFCDANTKLNTNAIINIVRHYKDPEVGAVAGEKRVTNPEELSTASEGEGAYWKYESTLKRWDSELHTVVGAAGELFSVRTAFYEPVPKGVIIEDFRLSMNIARNGYRVIYEPDAFAIETGSASTEEENKRKVRISAGGLKEVWHFRGLLNFFKYGMLTFQYVSHRMLRWTLAPLSLLLVFIANIVLVLEGAHWFYALALAIQICFYFCAWIGHLQRHSASKSKLFLLPYYFVFMNLAVYKGLGRLLKGSQSAVWEKAKRAEGY